ncbi:MAG: hypothetical protein ACFFD4_28850 [Candidatus Odinarchaeota archaeon]
MNFARISKNTSTSWYLSYLFLYETIDEMMEYFESIIKKYPKKHLKDKIVTWVTIDKKRYSIFRKKTPKIDNIDHESQLTKLKEKKVDIILVTRPAKDA